jgi:AcrR family transcriptional regulator
MLDDRMREVINICLDHFIENGLDSSTRSLSSALKLQNAGLYYYFDSKDDAIIACAEAAAIRLEETLLVPALKDLDNLDFMFKELQLLADVMTPTMRFLVSVCVNAKYKESMKPALHRLDKRYEHYAEMFAEKLSCKKEDIEPYVYLVITAVVNYMIFEEDVFIYPQMQIAKKAIESFLKPSNND